MKKQTRSIHVPVMKKITTAVKKLLNYKNQSEAHFLIITEFLE